jgi:hypothetical protein
MYAPELDNLPDTELDWEMIPLVSYRRAIADAYYEAEERLDVRFLWTRGPVSFFRVNWWRATANGTNEIMRSAFVSVERADEGLQVRDLSTSKAA